MTARYPERYAGYTLRQLCDEMHQFYRENNIKELQRQCFRGEHFPEQAMSVQAASEALVGNRVDYLPLSQCKGRISATLALIYPPGIGIVVPGERYDDKAQPMLDYFLVFEEAFNRFSQALSSKVRGCMPIILTAGWCFKPTWCKSKSKE